MNRNIQQWLKDADLSNSPLNNEPFKKGDAVTFINEYGVSFEGHKIIGFSKEIYPDSGTVYLDYDCYWFPAKIQHLRTA